MGASRAVEVAHAQRFEGDGEQKFESKPRRLDRGVIVHALNDITRLALATMTLRARAASSTGGSGLYVGAVDHDAWEGLADLFVDEAYATVKGHVRTYVMHHHLLDHLPTAPATVLDVGGGAGSQSFPLALAGYDVTLLDPSTAMLDKARQRREGLPVEAQRRVTLVRAEGERAGEALDGKRFDAVLCHGVLSYLDDPQPLVAELCRRTAAGGVVSIMTANAQTMAVRPAMERRWQDALAAFDSRREVGVLGVAARADTVEEVAEMLRLRGVEAIEWYGVWLFVDWLNFAGAALDPSDHRAVAATAGVELEASRRDPYRQMSRVFHLLGRKLTQTEPHVGDPDARRR